MAKSYHITENLLEVDVIKNFFDMSKKCRESIYYLESLEEIIKTHIVLPKDYSSEITNTFLTKIQDYYNEYRVLENRMSISINDEVNDRFVTYKNSYDVDPVHIYKSLLNYIELKSKIDNLQIEILKYLINIKINLCKEISQIDSQLESLYMQLNSDSHIFLAFHKSTDIDKIVTYVIKCSDKTIKKYLIDNNINVNQRFKIRDYTYELNLKRELYQMWSNAVVQLTKLLPVVEENELLRKINNKQLKYSKQVTILTWIVTILTLITVIFGCISTFSTFKNILYIIT